MSKELLSIIIVNYNGAAFLENCIQSIEKTCQGFDYEIIIVDNNSSDNSIEIIENQFDNISLIKSETNLGFAAGNNIGVKNSKGDYILLLNNDTVLLDNIYPAIELLKNNQNIGVVGIKMLDDKKMYRQSAGFFPSPMKLLKLKSMLLNTHGFLDGNFDKSNSYFDVDWIEASFLLTSRNLYDEVNGMDETFFMYAEDIDFCKRLISLGKKTVYLPELSYIHFGGFNSKRNELLKKGLIHFVKIHFFRISKLIGLLNIEINFFVKKYVKKSV